MGGAMIMVRVTSGHSKQALESWYQVVDGYNVCVDYRLIMNVESES